MARTIKDASLESRTARSRLRARGKPYYRSLEEGLHLGYRKPLSGAGKWIARHYVGDQAYQVEVIGVADDYSDADGIAVLAYWQAQAKARERMVARAHGTDGATGKTGPLTVRDAIEAYLEFLDAHRKTGSEARTRAKAFILPHLGDTEVQALTTEQIRKWHMGLAKTPARARTRAGGKQQYRPRDNSPDGIRRRQVTANRILMILKTALNRAWRDGRTPSDAPWRRVEPFKAVTAARARYLTTEEARRLVNACDAAFRPLVQAALATGCRYSELTRLQVGDFNADAGTVHIRLSKTGKDRHVVLNEEGRALFEALTIGRPKTDLLIVKADGMPWGESNQADPMAKACERARIEPPASFHCLRHTYASLAIMSGMPLVVVAKSLGHASTKMAEAHYGHLSSNYITDAVRQHAPKFGFKPSKAVVPIR